MEQNQPTVAAADAILRELEEDEVHVFRWLMDEIRGRFGASEKFDPNDPEFEALAKNLASRAL